MSREEQWSLFVSSTVGLTQYLRLSYKHYLLEKFVKETDPEEKVIIKGKFPFNRGELEAAEAYLRRYGKSQRRWILFPLAYIGIEVARVWYRNAKR